MERNYRITIEPLNDAAKKNLEGEERLTIECEGFQLVADRGDRTSNIVMGMSVVELANEFRQEDTLIEAAIIAEAMDRAKRRKIEKRETAGAKIGRDIANILRDAIR